MKKFLKIIGTLLLLLIASGVILFMVKNEALPSGEKGKSADALATKMLQAINSDAYNNAEVLEWSFRNEHHYKWFKKQNSVSVSWAKNKVILNTKTPEKSTVFVDNIKVVDPELIQTAKDYFNNDSFWLVAPYKVFDPGTERRIVKHEGKDALLITYTSGGTTPGDSYLWILADTGLPISFKMWTKIIPIGGVEASWDNLKTTESGSLLPTAHTLSLFGMKLPMGIVKSYNPKANEVAHKMLKAIKHDNYKTTNHIEWSFGGRRAYKWNKEKHIVVVSWDTIRVVLHPNKLEKLGFKKIDTVISSLPLSILPKELAKDIIKKSHNTLKDKGQFVQFQYSVKFLKQFKSIFKNKVELEFEPLNFPPAFVYICEK